MSGQRGFSLLEALIALLVLAVGLLGIASMQAASVYRTHVGTMNGLAAVEAQSISAAMTANQSAFPAGASSFPYSTTDAYAVSYPVSCTLTDCSATDMALFDLKQWGDEVRTNLPQGKGAVSCAGDPPQCTITVSWSEKELAPAATTTRRYSIVMRP